MSICKIWDNDKVYLNTLYPPCDNCLINLDTSDSLMDCPISSEKCRLSRTKAHNAEVFLCEKCTIVKNRKRYQDRLSILLSNIPFLKNIVNDAMKQAADHEREKYSQIVHNLKSLNAQNLFIQYDLIPQEKNNSYRDIFSQVEEIVKRNPREVTLTLLKLAKNNAHMKTEFSTHEKLSLESPVLFKQKHVLKSVILNVYHSFDLDFREKKIGINISDVNTMAYFDYETVRVSLYHIFFNAIKYIKPTSTLQVKIIENENMAMVIFSMESLYIFPDEVERIFEDHYSGRIPKSNNIAGEGLGMGLINRAITLNKGYFTIAPGINKHKYNNLLYSENKFTISLPKDKINTN